MDFRRSATQFCLGVTLAIAELWLAPGPSLFAQEKIPAAIYEQVTAEFEQGKLAEAEQDLRAALHEHPQEFHALALLAMVLDAQKRYADAEHLYTQALQLSPNNPALLNNLGNHFLAQGDTRRARQTYLRVVALEPGHSNANLQLAQISVTEKQPGAALKYLGRLPQESLSNPSVQVLRAIALDLSGQHAAAEALYAEIEKQGVGDPRVPFSIGMTYVKLERYAEAEKAFTQALGEAPTNFDILYNLGLAATRAGHLDRARGVFETALEQRPEDVDCLYNLARVYDLRDEEITATKLLYQAQRLAPQRAEVLILMARTTAKIGFYGDTAVAYDQYLKLRPDDDVARRERGFVLTQTNRVKEGLRDLEWYVAKHPKDAQGLYELAYTETLQDDGHAMVHLNRAIESNPNLLPARYLRAALNSRSEKPLAALKDLQFVLEREPQNYRALDMLGESYLQLESGQEAVKALQQALTLSPSDRTILMHCSRALLRIDRKEEAAVMLHKLEQLGPETNKGRPYSMLFDYLSLPPEEQKARYLSHLQTRIQMDPKDAALRAQLGKLLLEEERPEEALKVFSEIPNLTSDYRILVDCGRALLDYGQYAAARGCLENALAAAPDHPDLRIDLAIATFHSEGPAASLAEIDRMPAAQRQGDYYLLRAQILDGMGKSAEAAEALNRGFRAAPTRPDLYFQAAVFLIKHKELAQAIRFLEQANSNLPDVPELQLTLAIAYGMVRQQEDALRVLARIESGWPEWSVPYVIHGVILALRVRSAEAKAVLQAAIGLGARDPIAYYYLALSIINDTPDDVAEARSAIQRALEIAPNDPYIQALAGRIEYMQHNYQASLGYLDAALRIWPDMVEAHQDLAATYRAMGNKEMSIAELKEVLRIKQQIRSAAQTPPSPIENLLFTVRPPNPHAM